MWYKSYSWLSQVFRQEAHDPISCRRTLPGVLFFRGEGSRLPFFDVVCQRVSRPPSGSRRGGNVPASSRLSGRARVCNFRGGSGSACAPVTPFACARRGLLQCAPVGGRISQTEASWRPARDPRVPPSSPVGRCACEKTEEKPVD